MSLSDLGRFLIESVAQMEGFVQICIGLTIALLAGLLLLRYLPDLLRLNQFGETYRLFRKPTDRLIGHMRRSPYYHPLRRSFGFDPGPIMLLVAFAILWYVLTGVLHDLFHIIRGIGMSLFEFGIGSPFVGLRYLLGSILLAAIFYLMALMMIVFVNWLFDLLKEQSWWAMNRLGPLLRIFEFGGAFAGWSFVILWIALTFAAGAVQTIFF